MVLSYQTQSLKFNFKNFLDSKGISLVETLFRGVTLVSAKFQSYGVHIKYAGMKNRLISPAHFVGICKLLVCYQWILCLFVCLSLKPL